MKFVKLINNTVVSIVESNQEKLEGFTSVADKTEVSVGMVLIDGVYRLPTQTLLAQKLFLKKELWSLLPKKVVGAKKEIIGKPGISDEELETLLGVYQEKYQDAQNGLDVFEAQSALLSISQSDYRALIIAKGDAFVLAEKRVNDLIESVRQLMEKKIDDATTQEELNLIKEKMATLDNFSVTTPIATILEALNG